jgi:formylglycine-generating enzyme required for sulfatase activity
VIVSVEVARPVDLPPTVFIPGGSFLMGSEQGRPDERPVREVFVQPFRLGRTPVTNGEYALFLATGRVAEPPWWSEPAFARAGQPVVGVTWFDAQAYCRWLSDVSGGVWRLPSEAEWERAARGGLESAPTAWGEAIPAGEIPEGPLAAPWPVARGTPNGFGLHDMGTIVHEWCLDRYRVPELGSPGEPLPARASRVEAGGERRASRGGSWRHHVRWSSPSARSSLPPASRYADYGFRVVREVL